jgi:hypothetical protein
VRSTLAPESRTRFRPHDAPSPIVAGRESSSEGQGGHGCGANVRANNFRAVHRMKNDALRGMRRENDASESLNWIAPVLRRSQSRSSTGRAMP